MMQAEAPKSAKANHGDGNGRSGPAGIIPAQVSTHHSGGVLGHEREQHVEDDGWCLTWGS